ncbi:MAG: hypothetical protein ACLQCB_09420 [Spirochaetia bacterium]
MTKHVEQMMRRAEGALGRAFRQLDAAGNIAKKLDAETTKHPDKDNFVELLIIREVVERVARICNAAFIADSRATSPLPFPPREGTPGMMSGPWTFPRGGAKDEATRAASSRKRKRT